MPTVTPLLLFVVFVVVVFVAPQPLCAPVDPIGAPILAPPLSGRCCCRAACFALVVWHKAECKIGLLLFGRPPSMPCPVNPIIAPPLSAVVDVLVVVGR
jgi:hypothetical protein